MTLFKYKVLQTVMETGSLTKAAERLLLTQSGVSHAVASLEAEFGFSLLVRDRNGVTLTNNGERLLPLLGEILHGQERLEQEVAAIRGIEVGTIRIGTFTSVSALWLPSVIKEFQEQHPAVEIHLLEGDYEEIEKWIVNGSVDFGFVSLPTGKSLQTISLTQDELFCLLPLGHSWQERQSISIEAVMREPFIMPKWGNNGDVQRALRSQGTWPCVRFEVLEEQAIIAMVQNGLGISILPRLALRRNCCENIQLLPLERPVYRTIGAAFPSAKRLSAAARKFLDHLQNWLKREVDLVDL